MMPAEAFEVLFLLEEAGLARVRATPRLQAPGDDALDQQISKTTDQLGIDDMSTKVWVNRIHQECAAIRMTVALLFE